MAQSEARKKWDKENTFFIGMKLQNSTDADIIAFLQGKSKQTVIKAAIREYIANHTPAEEDIAPPWEDGEEENE